MKEFNPNYLDFEQPLLELEAKINQLNNSPEKTAKSDQAVIKLKKDYESLTIKVFSNLSDWQISQLARHPLRPYTLDYITNMFTSFNELHGDRMFGDDPAIISGIAKIEKYNFVFIGHQKGRDAKEKVKRNFGMPKPEGYRKALRIMKLAEKFNFPVITLLDTPGAYPGIGAEERGQGQAIAQNLLEMSQLKVPIISIVIGEGASGGALGIGLADKIICLENTWYSVISPEGCASILFRDAGRAKEAADAMQVTSYDLYKMGIADEIIKEPKGSAHINPIGAAEALKETIIRNYTELKKFTSEELIDARIEKYNKIGEYDRK